jgi:hypothetical protein
MKTMGSILYYHPDGTLEMPRSKSRLRDWLVSGPGKRRLLNLLFLEQPDREWTSRELAVETEQHPKARMTHYLGPLVQAGVLERGGAGYRVVDHPLLEPLRDLLRQLEQLPDDELE